MIELILAHRFEDGHEVEYDRNRVSMIEPGPDLNGTLVTLDNGTSTRTIHVKESYDEVKIEIHLSTTERMMRRIKARGDDASDVPFA